MKQMNKKDFVLSYAKRNKITIVQATTEVDRFLNELDSILSEGKDIMFTGSLSFKNVVTKERIGRNPKTGDEINIPSKKVIRIKAGKKLGGN